MILPTPQDSLQIPVIVQYQSKTLRVGKNLKDPAKCFWTELSRQVERVKTLTLDDHFGKATVQELRHLKVRSALLPRLLGHEEELVYEGKAKDKLSKAACKPYLESIRKHLGELNNQSKDTRDNSSTTNSLSKLKGFRRLDIWVSKFLGIWVSKCLDIWASKCLSV